MLLRWLIIIFPLLGLALKTESGIDLTNIECTTHSPLYMDFPYCYIKAVNRTYKYVSLRAHFYNTPVTNFLVTFTCLKRANGYKPFLYNMTVDGCSFMKNKKRFPVFNYLYQFFSSSSNINHSCPYQHDLMIEKLDIRYLPESVSNVLPFPPGQYCFHTHWQMDGLPRATVRAYATIS